MPSNLSMMIILNKLISKPQIPSQYSLIATLNLIINSRRGYYTTNKQAKKETLYDKISPLGHPGISLKPELDGWIQQGKKIRVAELGRIVQDLRKRKRFTQALEVSEWMNEKGLCKFTHTEHAIQLDLIGRVHGFLSAESYFNSLHEQDRTIKTYGALLHCYVRQRQIDKSLSHLSKMKELGFASSSLTYNDIMCLYTNTGDYEKVPKVLAEMKVNDVLPDNYSYRLCMNSYGVQSDMEALENILIEMETQPHMAVDWNSYIVAANFYIKAGLKDKAIEALRKAEVRLDKKDGTGYNHLISLYAKLENKEEIVRLWELEKSTCKRCINRDYVNVLESLVRISEVEEAEKVLKDWESSDNNYYDFRVPNIVIVGYLNKGFLEKAEAMLDEVYEKGKASSPNTWGLLARKYLEKGETKKAIECMKRAFSMYVVNKGWKPDKLVVSRLLRWVGDEGTLEDAESFAGALKSVVAVNREMYHALLKASIRCGKGVDGVLEKMRDDKVEEDGETKSILSKVSKKS